MFIDSNGKRINVHAPYTTQQGVTYGNLLNPEVRAAVGISEIQEPQPPEDYSEDTHYRTEQQEAPYVIYTRKSEEQIKQLRNARIQAQIDALEGGNPLARPTREFMLLSLEERAVLSGYTLEQLRANHYAYRKVKELDEQIAALRAQLG